MLLGATAAAAGAGPLVAADVAGVEASPGALAVTCEPETAVSPVPWPVTCAALAMVNDTGSSWMPAG